MSRSMKRVAVVMMLVASTVVGGCNVVSANKEEGGACKTAGSKTGISGGTLECTRVTSGKNKGKLFWCRMPRSGSSGSASGSSGAGCATATTSTRVPLWGNANIRASLTAFPRPLEHKCVPEPGQEGQYYRTTFTLAINPFDSQHLFIGIERLGVFESLNGGTSWSAASLEGVLPDMAKADGSICFKEVWKIEFDPAVRNRVYLLYGGTGSVNAKKWQARGAGLYVSNDRGKNWEFITEPWMHAYTTTLEIDPTNSNVIYMGGSSSPLTSTESNLNEVFVTKGLVYKSTDAGKTWTELPTGWGRDTRCTDVHVDPSNPNIVTISVFQTPTGQDPSRQSASGTGLPAGLYRSRDGGSTWARVGSSALHKHSASQGRFSDDGQMILFEIQDRNGQQPLVSSDGGATLVAPTNGVWFMPTVLPGSNRTGFFVNWDSRLGDTLIRTDDAGRTWQSVGKTPSEMQYYVENSIPGYTGRGRPSKLVIDPSNNSIMYMAGASGKIAKSTDGGASWRMLTTWESFPAATWKAK